MERREKILITIHTTGKTLDDILATAIKNLDGFFGDYKYEILAFRASPMIQTTRSEIIMWDADVEAGEVKSYESS